MKDRFCALTSSTSIFALLLTGLLPASSHAAEYTLTDLGTGVAVDINNSGVIALNDGGRAYRVVNGARKPLRVVVGEFMGPIFSDEAVASRINDAGSVVGTVADFTGPIAFLDRGDTNRWVASARGVGVNNLDEAVGGIVPGLTPAGPIPLAATLSFWPTPGATVLQPQNYGELRAINDSGVSVGLLAETKYIGSIPEPYRYTAYRARAVKVQGTQITYLDPRPAGDVPTYHNADPSVRLSEANAINAQGWIVGEMAVVPDGPKHAFRYTGAGLEDLQTLGGDTSSAFDVNDTGVIVGQSKTADGATHACRWSEGSIVDLNTFLPTGSSFQLVRAHGINNSGQIVGESIVGGETHAFLLSPMGLGVAPSITAQPASVTLVLGASTTLAVSAIGTLPLSYQWSRNNDPIDGATTHTLTLSNVTALQSGAYRVEVSNAFGKALSLPADVTVLDPRLTALNFAGLRIEGAVGATYRIEATPRLGPETWVPIDRVTLTNASQLWVDWESIEYALRIYRAIRLPPP